MFRADGSSRLGLGHIMRTLAMAEHLYLFMDGIDTFYARFPTIPRLPSDLLSE